MPRKDHGTSTAPGSGRRSSGRSGAKDGSASTAKIALGCLIGCITDGVLNMYQYIFAWNAHSVNLGSWSAFLPLRGSGAHSRYAEALIWGIPMYTAPQEAGV